MKGVPCPGAPAHSRDRWGYLLMIRIGMLFHDVSVIIQNLLLGVGVLTVTLGEVLAVRQSRLLLRRQRLRHRLCQSHG